ncbi:hypothetical protein HaLaN_24722 [Haematococcus lacustris]|uniref:Uncharacterized protein n=1 Tax=Haematococcus lacustris TaxID=44745 RepID=A0A6A0A4W0_HAELA|nr:hypothetical protein HaLaN_24722 [Haematococcus lacustris]
MVLIVVFAAHTLNGPHMKAPRFCQIDTLGTHTRSRTELVVHHLTSWLDSYAGRKIAHFEGFEGGVTLPVHAAGPLSAIAVHRSQTHQAGHSRHNAMPTSNTPARPAQDSLKNQISHPPPNEDPHASAPYPVRLDGPRAQRCALSTRAVTL